MPYFLAGLVLLILLLFFQRWYVNANPATLARSLTRLGGGFLLLLAVGAALLRRFEFAAPLAVVGMMVLQRGWTKTPRGWGGRQSENTTTVRSNRLEMTLDHDTGETDGKVIDGPHQGWLFSQLDVAQLLDLHAACSADDPEGVTLLEAYLDTMHAGWRDGSGSQQQYDATSADAGPMTREHAYEILGLQPGATADEIREAHRTLMRKVHPDQGGSNYLAQQINEAKDILLGD